VIPSRYDYLYTVVIYLDGIEESHCNNLACSYCQCIYELSFAICRFIVRDEMEEMDNG
jgi:hypothetical protein